MRVFLAYSHNLGWPISRILSPLLGGDHLSGMVVANHLAQPTRMSNGTSRAFILHGLAPGGSLPSQRHYCLCWWSLTPPFHPHGRLKKTAAMYSLLHLSADCSARPLTGTLLCGVRTFLTLDMPKRDHPASPRGHSVTLSAIRVNVGTFWSGSFSSSVCQ